MDPLSEIRPYLELTAISTGAISGALHANRRGFDFVGLLVIGFVSGLGGGILRDILLNQGPVLALQHSKFLLTAIFSSLLGALFASALDHVRWFMWLIDSLALGLFAVAGLQRAEAAGLNTVACVFLGVVNCVGGGVIRDVLCRETPALLLPGKPYTIVAVFAGGVYTISVHFLGITYRASEWLALLGALGLRALISRRDWVTPTAPDLLVEFAHRRQNRREKL